MIRIDEEFYLENGGHDIHLCQKLPDNKTTRKTYHPSVKSALKAYVDKTANDIPINLAGLVEQVDQIHERIDQFFEQHESIWPKRASKIGL